MHDAFLTLCKPQKHDVTRSGKPWQESSTDNSSAHNWPPLLLQLSRLTYSAIFGMVLALQSRGLQCAHSLSIAEKSASHAISGKAESLLPAILG